MTTDMIFVVYAIPMLGIWYMFARSRHRREASAISIRREAMAAGLDEPVSLHPLIDPAKCMGCGACVKACHEGDVLGLIAGKAHLIEPSQCIGHGACKTACPFDAITLVFGTETRGVELPVVGPDFQTNIPGVFVAGELGGMGLIRNAIEQGRQAMDAIAAERRKRAGNILDVIIVGAGPAGFSASLRAKELGLSVVTVEQETLGGTVAHYPRGKLVMTEPATLPIVGRMKFRETSKEELLEFWTKVKAQAGIKINYQERVLQIARSDGAGFVVSTDRGSYAAQNILLAIGRRGTPRKLGVPGEDQAKVTYRLIDPEQYAGQRVTVVGGGDSALEAAVSLAAIDGTDVTLSYRGKVFARCRPKNRSRLEEMQRDGRLRVLLDSNVTAIGPDRIAFVEAGKSFEIGNDAVIVCAGGILPSGFLRDVGIHIETKYGTE